MTHNQQILSHLKSGKSITALEALSKFGSLRLSARICDLKELGHAIEKRMVEVETRNGRAHFAQYWMV
jgi:hypothetical protein